MKRVVIIGGGFGGLELAKNLDERKFQIILLDKNNYHTFQPLLYQIATGGLEPGHIAYPIRKIFRRKKNFFFRIATALQIDASQNVLKTDLGDIFYDVLVIASGSTTNFFGNESLSQHALTLKSMSDALNMRSLILQNCEAALLSKDEEKKKRLLNILIIGGGPTGVEVAGAVAELKRHVLPGDYPELDFSLMNIHLIEAGKGLLLMMSPQAQNNSLKSLQKLGVEISLNTMLKEYDGHKAILNDGRVIESEALIWTAGVKGKLIGGLKEDAAVKGRFAVDGFNRIKGYENIFAIGDVAAMSLTSAALHPMLAPVAIQQGHLLAENLNSGEEKKWKSFHYVDKGTMATIGRSRAVADLKLFKLHGFIAWMAWLFVHLIMLIGFRNRLVVLIYWLWNYLTYDYSVRLVIRPFKKPNAQP